MKRPSPWGVKRSPFVTVWIGDKCWCWRWWRGAGLSVPAVVTLPAGSDRRGFLPDRGVFDAMKMPHMEAAATAGDVIPLPESVILKKLPHVAELLLQPTWEDGPHKGKRVLSLIFEGSIVKLFIKLEGQRLKTMVSARGIDEAFAGLETLLKAGTVPWEQEQEEVKPAAKKRR